VRAYNNGKLINVSTKETREFNAGKINGFKSFSTRNIKRFKSKSFSEDNMNGSAIVKS